MFALQRQQVLHECKWSPGEGQLRYIETRTFADTANAGTHSTFQEEDLSDLEVDDWLHQRGRFTRPIDSGFGKEDGSIRLLICERFGFHPLEFGLSKASLLAIEKEFGLPVEMLPIFKLNGGGYSYHFHPSVPCNREPEQLVITIKVPQMFQVANYGLCLRHSFKTHATVGFMFGWNMFKDEYWKENFQYLERPEYLELHGPRISKLIQSETSNWMDPLLLPVILLEDHVYNADKYKGRDLSQSTTILEGDLGVTRAGRNANSSETWEFDKLSENMKAEKRFTIITDINTTVTDVITFIGNLKWDHRYCQSLQDISKEIAEVPGLARSGEPKLDNTVKALANFVASISEHAEALKVRLDIQLSVLYNLVAQVDSNMNSTIAANTGLDSVAMKALAFVTTIFLPPTFIATLFSMSMFDWQAEDKAQPSDPSNGTKVVSRHFWIYWVISMPLTIVVLLSWRTWWHWEKDHYRQKYSHVKLDRLDVGSKIVQKLTEITWTRKKLEDIEELDSLDHR